MDKPPRFLKKYILTIVTVPLIVALHYGWLEIQKNDVLVPDNKKSDLPIVVVSIDMLQ